MNDCGRLFRADNLKASYSTDFVLQDALTNAVAALRTAAGFRNPDIGLHFEVVQIGGQVGGFTLHTGVFVTVKAG